ncbi:MAG: hypothetical protein WCK11_01020 [Candidatus Falkowbacteria bacterium]
MSEQLEDTTSDVETNKPKLETNNTSPAYDTKYSQAIGLIEGEVANNWQPKNDDQAAELKDFFHESVGQLKRLSTAKGLKDVHRFNETEDFANGLAILVNRFSVTKNAEFSPDVFLAEEIKKENEMRQTRDDVFMSTAKKLFPEIQPPTTIEDCSSALSNLSKTSKDVTSFGTTIRAEMENISSSTGDIPKTIEKIDNYILRAGDSIIGAGNFGENDMRDQEFGIAETHRSDVVESAKLVYQLQLVRDRLQKELYGREDVTKTEAEKIDSIRTEIKKEIAPREDLEKSISKELSLLGDRLLYPFPYDMSFKKLPDDQFELLTDNITEIGKSWRNDKRPSFEKNKEYITKINDVLNKFRPNK